MGRCKVSWFRRRKRKDEYEVFTNEVPITTMVRWFIHDIGYGNNNVDTFIGLPPVSEEGNIKESQDSEERLIELKPLVPFIDSMSDISSNVLSSIAVYGASEDDIPEGEELEEMAELLNNLYKSISLSTLIGAFSTASALGLIQITALTSDLQTMQKDGEIYE
jgi:hypothetical protein